MIDSSLAGMLIDSILWSREEGRRGGERGRRDGEFDDFQVRVDVSADEDR